MSKHRLFHTINLHPRTMARLRRSLVAICPQSDFTNVPTGWMLGQITNAELEMLLVLDIEKPIKPQAPKMRICHQVAFTYLRRIRERFAKQLQWIKFRGRS